MSYAEDDYLLISGIQHFMFCRRQWTLIHIEQQWQENRLTVEGEVIHRNAHKDDFIEKRPGILVTRGLRVSSPTLKITGQCDVVEFLSSEEGVPLHGHRGYTPKVKTSKKCQSCSLKGLCLPKLCRTQSVADYMAKSLGEERS